MADLGFEADDNVKIENEYKQRIAQITFAFFNEKVINWLIERGQYIRDQ